jgi:hypothetical protein
MSLLRIINTQLKSARLFQYNCARLRIMLLFLMSPYAPSSEGCVSEVIMITTTKYSDRMK